MPEVLRSGDHARIARWRRAQALRRTLERRPDLLAGRPLTADEQALLREFAADESTGDSGGSGPATPWVTSTFPDHGALSMNATDLVDRASLRTTSPTSAPATR